MHDLVRPERVWKVRGDRNMVVGHRKTCCQPYGQQELQIAKERRKKKHKKTIRISVKSYSNCMRVFIKKTKQNFGDLSEMVRVSSKGNAYKNAFPAKKRERWKQKLSLPCAERLQNQHIHCRHSWHGCKRDERKCGKDAQHQKPVAIGSWSNVPSGVSNAQGNTSRVFGIIQKTHSLAARNEGTNECEVPAKPMSSAVLLLQVVAAKKSEWCVSHIPRIRTKLSGETSTIHQPAKSVPSTWR